MKLFSTRRRVIPATLTTANITAKTRTLLPWNSVRRAKYAGKRNRSLVTVGFDLVFSIISSNVGNNRNEVANATAKPALIIHPKSMTGLISLTTRELKPMMVVSAV